MQGQIIKIVSDLHIVSCEGHTYPCKCRGIFRKEHITPLVGDYVLFSKEKNVIEKILPRKNEFNRPKVSNIDQAFLITSLVKPDFSFNLLDKLLVTMELHNVEPIICITKEGNAEIQYAPFHLGDIKETINKVKDEKMTKQRQLRKEINKYKERANLAKTFEEFLETLTPEERRIVDLADNEIMPVAVAKYFSNNF